MISNREFSRNLSKQLGFTWNIVSDNHPWEELLVWFDQVLSSSKENKQHIIDNNIPPWVMIYNNKSISDILIIGDVGDVDPIIHGGGIIFQHPSNYYILEITDGIENIIDNYELHRDNCILPIHQMYFDNDSYNDLGGLLDQSFMSFIGSEYQSVEEYIKENSADITTIAQSLTDMMLYFGPQNLSASELEFNILDLAERWNIDPEYYL